MDNEQQNIKQDVIFTPTAHDELLRGASILATAVASTLGPSGHSVIIDNLNGRPIITKDGVTVARSINLKNRLQALGAELIKEVAEKTNERAGDGTTTATVLAHTMLAEGIKMIATGRSSIHLKRGMDLATEEIIRFLKENSIPISSKEDIINVGTISANGDRYIGMLLADAIEKVGQDGIITIEPAKSVQTNLEIVEGIQINGGYNSPFFITNSEKATCELENPHVLITPGKISSLTDIIKILEGVAKNNGSLLIVADDVEGDALHTLIVNKTKGVLKVCAVKAPSYGEFRADILADLAVVVGCNNIFGATSAVSLKNAGIEHLGSCKKAIVGRGNTTIIANLNDEKKVLLNERITSLKTLLTEDKTLDALHIDKYRKRLACLSGGIAVIKVGGSTEVEISEKKDRVEDAVNATMAAAQEGIVPGGGIALFYAAQHLKELLAENNFKYCLTKNELNNDVISGIEMLATVCEAPFKKIIENTGVSHEVVAEQLRRHQNGYQEFFINLNVTDQNDVVEYIDTIKKKQALKTIVNEINGLPENNTNFRYGYNAATKKYGDLVEEGIIDPIKVSRLALEYATSVVGLTLTCNAVILNKIDEMK